MANGTQSDERADRATLSEIAERAGVSISTVSKVLNGRVGVSADTRVRVTGILHDRQYNRRGTSSATAPLLELVCQEIDSPWILEIVVGTERVAREKGLSLVVTTLKGRPAPGTAWIEGVVGRRPRGVILVITDITAAERHQLATHDIPFVIVDPEGDPAPDVPSIGSANWMGGFLATRHLIELGHTAIASVAGPSGVLAATARLSGYRAALAGAGLIEPSGYARSGGFDFESGLALGGELLARSDRPSAIVVASDMQALGVYEAARLEGLAIPHDLSVVGYDDLPMSRFTGPPLTTVRQPLAEMAAEATRLVLRLVDEPHLRSTRIELGTSLIVRASTAPPAQN